jgi:hypothetical protein
VDDSPRGRRFADDDRLKYGAREEVRRLSKEVYATGIQLLKQRLKNVLVMKENLWRNTPHFVQDVPTIV